MFFTTRQIFCVRSNQEEETGGACSTGEGTGEGHVGFGWGKLRERVHLEYLGVDGNLIFKWILKEQEGALNSIDRAQGRDKE